MKTPTRRAAIACVCALAWVVSVAPGEAAAGQLEAAMQAIDDGKLRFHFEARPGVYGDGRRTTINMGHRDPDEDMWPYEPGPVRVVLTLE